ncbi:uncharacterized protein PEZ65_017587 isoform 1-T1 [Lycodopsis pacificus]
MTYKVFSIVEPSATLAAPTHLKGSQVDAAALTVRRPVPVPQELMCLLPEGAGRPATEATVTVPVSEAPLISPETSAEPAQLSPAQRDQSEPSPRPLAVPTRPPPQLPGYDHEVSQWTRSQQQRIWMKTELESTGLWPGSFPFLSYLMKMVSLWCLPPQPE